MRKWIGSSVIAVIAAALLVTGLQTDKVQAQEEDFIAEGVYAGELELSGMTVSQAKDTVQTYVTALGEKQITLMAVQGNEVTIPASELQLNWANPEIIEEAVSLGKEGSLIARYKAHKDLQTENKVYPIKVEINPGTLKSLLEEQCASFDIPAVNAHLTRVDGAFVIEDGQIGYKLDVDASVQAVSDYIRNAWNHQDDSIDLVVIMDEPEGSADTLAKVKDVLGTFTTSYKSSNANRCGNIATGCKHINGATIYPGETFSVGEAVTPFSVANGYYMAGSYLNGQVVDSLGGGICQVSTTLYNAVLLSELQVDERYNHSMIVSYVDPSADAAIAWDSGKDLKFTNNTDYPIYIEGITENKTITFTIYGVETRPANRKIRFESVVLEKNVPAEEKIFADASKPIGFVATQSAHIGYKAQLWKVVTVDGEQTERTQINSSSYKATPRQATVGVATGDPNAYNHMMAAIATGSIDQVKATAAAIQAAQQAAVPLPATGEQTPAVTETPADAGGAAQ